MATVSFHASVPGFQSPAVGFEAPFEMLEACHERVQRMLGLLARLQAHLETVGCDDQAKQAAIDVMRYFDQAAPLHHQDEELHVFPPLLKGPDAAMHALVQTLQQQHKAMEALWSALRLVLQAVADKAKPPSAANPTEARPLPALDPKLVADFTNLYQQHIALEETRAYPAARGAHTADSLQQASLDMMRRRGVRT